MTTPVPRPRPDRRTGPRAGALLPLRDLLFGFLRWLGRHVSGFYAAVGAFLVLGMAAVLGGTVAFAALAHAVMEGRTQQVDDAVLRWMGSHGSPAMDGAMLEVTSLGGRVVVWVLVLVSSAFLWQARRRWSAALVWVAVLGSGLVNLVLKEVFNRPRPDVFPWRTPHVGNASFPSGHATTAIVAYGVLGYLLARGMKTRSARVVTWILAIVAVLAVGISRLYLGVHYPSDVLGGFATGGAWAFICGMGMQAVRYFARRRPGTASEESGLAGAPRP